MIDLEKRLLQIDSTEEEDIMDGEASEGEDGLGETVCPCGKVYEEGMFMIQCDICRDWMHGECVRYDVMVIIVKIIFIDI